MSKRIKDTDYLHLSTRIRAMENALLERERMDRMLEAGTVEEAAKVLTECGYPELQAVNVDTVDAMLAQAREELFGTLNDLAPDGEILDVFKVKYDYHNAKAMLKCEALGLDPERLLVDTGRVAPETLAEAVKRSEFTDLPKVMADAIVEARAVLGKTRDPQRSDMILDQAYFQEMEQLAKDSGSQFLLGYVQMLVDAANLRSVVRVLRMGRMPTSWPPSFSPAAPFRLPLWSRRRTESRWRASISPPCSRKRPQPAFRPSRAAA